VVGGGSNDACWWLKVGAWVLVFDGLCLVHVMVDDKQRVEETVGGL